ncbi:MAG: putative oxidoreductase [Paracoccaceae bacterium]|jgi:putative oxidoreductase
MTALINLHARLFAALEAYSSAWLFPTLARILFAGVLLGYYWASGLTKLGDGFLGIFFVDFGAYAQILPRVLDSAGYDPSQIGILPKLIVLATTWGEFTLPLLIILGLFTRLAALGMIGFVIAQSWVDIFGHQLDAVSIGSWFDRAPGGLILDQRAFWIFVLLVLVVRGAGPVSLDAVLGRRYANAS